jgi:6-phosphogluconolactonase/glucosamine-6-phosphate isomerase/deaminase
MAVPLGSTHMRSIRSDNAAEAVEELAAKLAGSLLGGRVLWLVCGGSNIPYSVAVMNILRARVGAEELQNLTIALTDERYGPVSHPDSNWWQLIDAGFSFAGTNAIPVLMGAPLAETVSAYALKLEEAFETHPMIIAQFGIGSDGHIAGILPHSPAVSDSRLVSAYKAGPYTRITLTLRAFEPILIGYALVFGDAKREVIERLCDETLPLKDMPSQILKQLPEAYLYSDQL